MKSAFKDFWNSPWGDLLGFLCLVFCFCAAWTGFFDPDVCAARDIAFEDSSSIAYHAWEGSVALFVLVFCFLHGVPLLYSAIRKFRDLKRAAAPSEEVAE